MFHSLFESVHTCFTDNDDFFHATFRMAIWLVKKCILCMMWCVMFDVSDNDMISSVKTKTLCGQTLPCGNIQKGKKYRWSQIITIRGKEGILFYRISSFSSRSSQSKMFSGWHGNCHDNTERKLLTVQHVTDHYGCKYNTD